MSLLRSLFPRSFEVENEKLLITLMTNFKKIIEKDYIIIFKKKLIKQRIRQKTNGRRVNAEREIVLCQLKGSKEDRMTAPSCGYLL